MTTLEQKQKELIAKIKEFWNVSNIESLAELECEIAELEKQAEEQESKETFCSECRYYDDRMRKNGKQSHCDKFKVVCCEINNEGHCSYFDKPTRAEEIKHKLISLSFEFEDSDGVKHSPWITLEDAIRILEQYRTEGLREELIEFLVHQSKTPARFVPENEYPELVDEYLKLKGVTKKESRSVDLREELIKFFLRDTSLLLDEETELEIRLLITSHNMNQTPSEILRIYAEKEIDEYLKQKGSPL